MSDRVTERLGEQMFGRHGGGGAVRSLTNIYSLEPLLLRNKVWYGHWIWVHFIRISVVRTSAPRNEELKVKYLHFKIPFPRAVKFSMDVTALECLFRNANRLNIYFDQRIWLTA